MYFCKRKIAVDGTNVAQNKSNKLALKNEDPFRSFISKINNSFIGNVEGLDIVILMYNLYSVNYFKT